MCGNGLGMDVHSCVGDAVADEFKVYYDIVADLPDLSNILDGDGRGIPFPSEVSAQYAVCVGLAMRSDDEHQALHAFEWLNAVTGPEWVQTYIADAMIRLQSKKRFGPFAAMVHTNPRLGEFVETAIAEVVA